MNEDIKKENTESETSISKYECELCDKFFTDISSLGHHVNEYHSNNCREESKCLVKTKKQNKDAIFKCDQPDCGKIFGDIYKLSDHVVVHTKEKPMECHYYGCEKSFKRKKDLMAHMKVHSGERSFKCNYEGCEKAYKSKSNLRIHINECHNQNKLDQSVADSVRFKLCKCEHCGKSFKNIYKLKDHLIVHSDERPFQCEHEGCAKSFKRKSHLNEHVSVHIENSFFQCTYEKCKKIFKSRDVLRKHLRLHTSDAPFKCNHEACGKAFKRNTDLIDHQRTHILDSGSLEMIVCEYPGCDTRFRWKRSYLRHMRKHNERRQHSCTFQGCNATFYRSDHLSRHIRSHTERPSHSSGSIYPNESLNFKAGFENDEGCGHHKVKEESIGEVDGHQCSISEKTISEKNEHQKYAQCSREYIKCEFVDVDQVNHDLTVDEKFG